MATESTTMIKATCLICNDSTDNTQNIEWLNWYGECLNYECGGTLLRWDYADGSIRITNSTTDTAIEWENTTKGTATWH